MLAELGNQRGGKLTLEAFLAINDLKLRNRRSLLDRKAIDDRETKRERENKQLLMLLSVLKQLRVH